MFHWVSVVFSIAVYCGGGARPMIIGDQSEGISGGVSTVVIGSVVSLAVCVDVSVVFGRFFIFILKKIACVSRAHARKHFAH